MKSPHQSQFHRLFLPTVFFVLLAACKNESAEKPASPPQAPLVTTDTRPAVLILGDSLTAGFSLPADQAVPAHVQRFIDADGLSFRVINGGRSGDTTAGGLARIAWYLKPEIPLALVVVNLGSNDALRGFAPEEMEKNLVALFEKIKAARPGIPLFLASLEIFPNMGENYQNAYKAVFPSVSSKVGAKLFDLPLSKVITDPALNLGDGAHPNADGAKLLAEAMWSAMKGQLHELQQTGE